MKGSGGSRGYSRPVCTGRRPCALGNELHSHIATGSQRRGHPRPATLNAGLCCWNAAVAYICGFWRDCSKATGKIRGNNCWTSAHGSQGQHCRPLWAGPQSGPRVLAPVVRRNPLTPNRLRRSCPVNVLQSQKMWVMTRASPWELGRRIIMLIAVQPRKGCVDSPGHRPCHYPHLGHFLSARHVNPGESKIGVTLVP